MTAQPIYRYQPRTAVVETAIDFPDLSGQGYALTDVEIRFTADTRDGVEAIETWGYLKAPRRIGSSGHPGRAAGAKFAWLPPPIWLRDAIRTVIEDDYTSRGPIWHAAQDALSETG